MSPAGGARVEIAIAVVQQDGQFLIGLRPEDVALASLWEFPGGKVDPGESPAAAAARECLEETGLEVRIGPEYSPTEYNYAHADVRLHFFACTPLRELAPLPSRFRWVSRDELGQYAFPPANAALLKMLTAK